MLCLLNYIVLRSVLLFGSVGYIGSCLVSSIIAMSLFFITQFFAVAINKVTLLLFDIGCISTISDDELFSSCYCEHFNVSKDVS